MKQVLILLGLLILASCTASTAQATHCPGCDTTAPDYGSSAWERRYDAGKYQEGNGQYPYQNRQGRSYDQQGDTDRYSRERDTQEQTRREQHRNTYDNNGGYNYDSTRP